MRSLSLPILALALVQGVRSQTADPESIRPPMFSLDSSWANSSSSTSRSSSATSSSISTTSKSTISLSSTSLSTISSSPTNSSGNGTTAAPTPCTGCILEAFSPTTLTFETKGVNISTSTSVVGTIITSIITYDDGEATILSTQYNPEPTGLNATTRPTNLVTELTFTWEPVPNVTLTFTSGTTYVAYTEIYGGVESTATPEPTEEPLPTIPAPTAYPTCDSFAHHLRAWPPEDGNYDPFIQTLTGPTPPGPSDGPVSLPPALIQYLQGISDFDLFTSSTHQLSTCTLNPKTAKTPMFSITPTIEPSAPPPTSVTPVIGSSKTGEAPKSTLLTTTFTESTVHVASPGACLRTPCQNPLGPTKVGVPETPESKIQEVPGDKPTPENPANKVPADKTAPAENHTPSIPEIIASIIAGNPSQFGGIQTDAPQNKPIQSATFSDAVLPIAPLQPTAPRNPEQPNGPQNTQDVPNPQVPGVVIGDHTLTPGQATTINGVPVSVPANAGGSSVVIGGSTFAVGNPSAPTGAPVLTVGGNLVTANPSGQFVIGTQTLNPGGPAIVVSGTTLSLGPSGTIAVVNGATQTLGNAPVITGPPALTINGQTIPATVVGGTTEFVLGEGKTLTPGGTLVADGTTFSLPAGGSGSTVVINGVTQTLSPAAGLPILTVNGNNPITASVVGGTTQFVIGPGQTLTPGGSIVVSGTTFSMPATASGSVVVVNGVTSTLGHPGQITAAPALTIDGKTYAPTVKDGTTEYVLGPGTTLKPGEAVTISGTTYSLDKSGTALVVNGKTSTIPKTPASNTASTTGSSSSGSTKSSGTSSRTSSTSTQRPPGNFIASGIGVTSKKGGATALRSGGLDKWVEGMVIGLAGWLVMLL